MPLDKSKARQVLRAGVLLCCLGLEGWLFWYNLFGRPGVGNGIVLTFASLALLLVLTVTGILPVPSGLKIPFFGIWPTLADSVKSAAFFLAIFVWTPLAIRLVPDTAVGMAIILVPDGLFVLAALVYLSNGLSRSN